MNSIKGTTLIITLLILFMITLLSFSAIQVTSLQEKMSANFQDKEISFNAAESALTEGEQLINSISHEPTVYVQCSPYPCVETLKIDFDYTQQSDSWWASHSTASQTSLGQLSMKPQYIIEFIRFVPDNPVIGDSSQKSSGTYYYQITSRGKGAREESISILQSVIARRY